MTRTTINNIFNLEKKTIVLTGSAGRLGSGFAHVLSSAGADVVLVDIENSNNKKLEFELKQKYNTNKVTYAGRLDPLAYGLVIILTDEDVHKRDEFTGKNKIYQFNVIHGIQTDTFDIMGMIYDKDNK